MSDDIEHPADALVPIADVCPLTGLSERQLRRLTASGELPHYRIGRAVRYRLSDVERFLEQRRHAGHLAG